MMWYRTTARASKVLISVHANRQVVIPLIMQPTFPIIHFPAKFETVVNGYPNMDTPRSEIARFNMSKLCGLLNIFLSRTNSETIARFPTVAITPERNNLE